MSDEKYNGFTLDELQKKFRESIRVEGDKLVVDDKDLVQAMKDNPVKLEEVTEKGIGIGCTTNIGCKGQAGQAELK